MADRLDCRRAGLGRDDRGGKLGERLMTEEEDRIDPEPRLPGPRCDLNDQDRIQSQFKEVVENADPIDPENIPRDPREFGLDRPSGRHEFRPVDGGDVDRGEGAAVDLAVGRERQGVQHLDRRRESSPRAGHP